MTISKLKGGKTVVLDVRDTWPILFYMSEAYRAFAFDVVMFGDILDDPNTLDNPDTWYLVDAKRPTITVAKIVFDPS